MRRLSIGLRLTLWYLAIFALAQLIFGAGMWLILRHNLYDLVDDGLEAQVDDLKNFLQTQPPDRSLAKLQEEVHETYAIEHSGDYLELYTDNNQLIYRSAFVQAHAVVSVATRSDQATHQPNPPDRWPRLSDSSFKSWKSMATCTPWRWESPPGMRSKLSTSSVSIC